MHDSCMLLDGGAFFKMQEYFEVMLKIFEILRG